MQRRHVVRPVEYEAIELMARVEVDSDNEDDAQYFAEDLKATGQMLSEDIDILLDSDVDRALRSDGEHINETHLWVFYEKE